MLVCVIYGSFHFRAFGRVFLVHLVGVKAVTGVYLSESVVCCIKKLALLFTVSL